MYTYVLAQFFILPGGSPDKSSSPVPDGSLFGSPPWWSGVTGLGGIRNISGMDSLGRVKVRGSKRLPAEGGAETKRRISPNKIRAFWIGSIQFFCICIRSIDLQCKGFNLWRKEAKGHTSETKLPKGNELLLADAADLPCVWQNTFHASAVFLQIS